MEVGEDTLDPLRVVQPPLDPVSTCPQQYKPCLTGTNSGRPLMTSKTSLTGCQVEPPDSCTPMKLKALGPHALSHGRTDDQLECRLPWQSPRSIGLCGSSWYLWCCGSSVWTCADSLSGSVGFKWAIPGTVIHSGACVGSWFFARKPGSGSRDTTSWRWVFPLANTHLPGAILNACRYERHLAEANANRNTHFNVRHFRGMTSSEDSPSSSLWDVNGGLSKDNKTRWRSHLGMILRCTGRSNRKALTSSLMWGSAAWSYTQWCSTEATDVRCDIIVEGSSPSLKRCIM